MVLYVSAKWWDPQPKVGPPKQQTWVLAVVSESTQRLVCTINETRMPENMGEALAGSATSMFWVYRQKKAKYFRKKCKTIHGI